MNKKKGVSPVVASVLMVLLVVMLASMVFLWARGFMSEQIEKFGTPIKDQCANINFNAVYGAPSGTSGSHLDIVNIGNIDIFHFDIKMTKGGNSEFQRFDYPVESGQGVTNPVTLKMKDGTTPDEIVIYPALLGTVVGKNSKKVFTCLDNGVTL